MGIFAKLQTIDRRILYVLIALVIAVPLLKRPARHPHIIFSEVRNAYKAMDTVPKGKIAILSVVWGPGTRAENEPQTEALMRHLFRNGTKFVVLSWDPLGTEISYDDGVRIAREMGKRYGTDWVHLGYNPGPMYTVISGMAKDFHTVFKKDKLGRPLSAIPVTRDVKNYTDIGAVAEITPSGTVNSWIAYFSMPYHKPLVFCPTAVMAAEAYPFLDSGQISGMLNGVIGAAQYETLLGMGNQKTYAAAASWALSSAHIFIIFLILLGNLGYAMAKRRGVRDRGGIGNG